MEPRFELFDHTADIGVRVFAPTREGLVPPAVAGLYSVIGEIVAGGQGKAATWTTEGGDAAELLRDFLTEVLAVFERDHCVVKSLTVRTYAADRLVVEGRVCPIDEPASSLHREIKAVTYHALAVTETDAGFEATYIVDI